MIQYMSSRVSDSLDPSLDFFDSMQTVGQDENNESFIKQLEKQMDKNAPKQT